MRVATWLSHPPASAGPPRRGYPASVRLVHAWLPAAVIAAVIFGLSSVPGLAVADGLWDTVTRKGAHLTIYAALAVACVRGLRAHGVRGDAALVGALTLAVLYAVSDELHQSTVPERAGTVTDVGIDTVGAVAGLLLVRRSARVRRVVTA